MTTTVSLQHQHQQQQQVLQESLMERSTRKRSLSSMSASSTSSSISCGRNDMKQCASQVSTSSSTSAPSRMNFSLRCYHSDINRMEDLSIDKLDGLIRDPRLESGQVLISTFAINQAIHSQRVVDAILRAMDHYYQKYKNSCHRQYQQQHQQQWSELKVNVMMNRNPEFVYSILRHESIQLFSKITIEKPTEETFEILGTHVLPRNALQSLQLVQSRSLQSSPTLTTTTTTTTSDLHHDPMTRAIQVFADGLSQNNQSLQELILEHQSHIPAKQIEILFRGIVGHATLQILTLRRIHASDKTEGCKMSQHMNILKECLSHPNCQLERLDMEYAHDFFHGSAMDALIEGLRQNHKNHQQQQQQQQQHHHYGSSCLKYLNVSSRTLYGCKTRLAKLVTYALSEESSLETLNISNNLLDFLVNADDPDNATDCCYQRLLSFMVDVNLTTNPLRLLDLSNNGSDGNGGIQLSDSMVDCLVKLVEYRPKLRSLGPSMDDALNHWPKLRFWADVNRLGRSLLLDGSYASTVTTTSFEDSEEDESIGSRRSSIASISTTSGTSSDFPLALFPRVVARANTLPQFQESLQRKVSATHHLVQEFLLLYLSEGGFASSSAPAAKRPKY